MADSVADRNDPWVLRYCVLACLGTWLLATPAALCFLHRGPPTPLAVAGAGLSAFGPLLAALLVAAAQGQLRSVFRPWQTRPVWVLLGLLAPLATHLAASALYALLGGPVPQWLHPPVTPEHVAALVVFPLGEEFGWRGYLQPRLAARHGVVQGALYTGLVWGVWHLAYSITPETGRFDLVLFGLGLIKLPLWSVIIAWAMQRARGSLAVALAFHAGAHLDNLQRATPLDLGLQGLHSAVLVLLAWLAARALVRGTATQSAAAIKASQV